AAGRLDHLAITRSPELSRPTATLGKFSQPFGVIEDALDEIRRCNRVFQGDVVGDRVEIAERGLRPDYFSHRARRFLAWACVATRPSATACSPRAMPSRTVMRCCMSS